jgi:hypothetical protein
MTSGDRVAQLYPQALGTHFSCLLRHAWVTVGLFFNPGHHTGEYAYFTNTYLMLRSVLSSVDVTQIQIEKMRVIVPRSNEVTTGVIRMISQVE